MIIESWHWRKSQPMAETYIHDFERLRTLYEFDPWDDNVWHERADWLDRSPHAHADRRALVDGLMAYHKRIGATEQMIENVKRLGDGRPLVVIGGQQTGLFTGPMLAVWKAVSIIHYARSAARRLGRPVIPVYWLAGEDHDWEEVNHVHWPTGEGTVHKYRLPDVEGAGMHSISNVRLTPDTWLRAVEAISRVLPDTEWKRELIGRMRMICGMSQSLTDHFARMLVWLFGKHGLVLVDSHDPGLRAIEREMFSKLIRTRRTLNEALLSGVRHVLSLGFSPQAPVSEGQSHLFVQTDFGRTLLVEHGDDGFADKRGNQVYTEREMLRMSQDSPERFSNGALTRPLMQEYLFPVLAAVLGPSEIAYWGQLKEAFHLFGMKMPPLVPRHEFTLVEPAVRKYMDEFGLTLQEAAEHLPEKRDAWLKKQDRWHLDERFARVRREMLQAYEPLLQTISEINGGMGKIAVTNREKIEAQIDYLERKAKEAVAIQSQAGLRQWARIEQCVVPLGKPQERVFNILAYINQFGTEWLDRLTMEEADARLHQVVYL